MPWSDAFVDIEGPERKPAEHPLTRFKMMYDDDTLYVGAELIEPKIWGPSPRRTAPCTTKTTLKSSSTRTAVDTTTSKCEAP